MAKKWEYNILTKLSGYSTKELNDIGSDGWELCSIITHNSVYTYYFKREVDEGEQSVHPTS